MQSQVYLLGQKNKIGSPLHKYQELKKKCEGLGDFLSHEDHLPWLSCYEKDSQPLHAIMPLLVFRPHSANQIAPFIKICFSMSIKVAIRCGGTGLRGDCVPGKESVVLLTGHLKQIKHYDRESGSLTVESGVTVREINAHVSSDGWHFPLSMATSGVAGLAGCLSNNARGYHRQHCSILNFIDRVVLVDGNAEVFEAPAAIACGAKGLLGAILELKVKLQKKPSQQKIFFCSSSWEEVLAKLPLLYSIQSLIFIAWINNRFYFGLEGEDWRVCPTVEYLTNLFPEIQSMEKDFESIMKSNLPSRQAFFFLSTVFPSCQLPEACQWSFEQAENLQLECLQQADVLTGSLNMTLQSNESCFLLMKKMELFLCAWSDFAARHRGTLMSYQASGEVQRNEKINSYWTEESQTSWKKLQAALDPNHLFGRENSLFL